MSINTDASPKACYEDPGIWMERLLAKPSAELFIENVDALLRKQGKSAADLARHLGVGRSLITAWKQGRSDPGVERLSDVANYFNVPVSSLFIDPTDDRSTGITLDVAIRIVSEAAKKSQKDS